MRINEIITELTGFKQHPAYLAVKDLEHGTPDDGNTEYDPEKMGTVTQQLEKLGWHPIGSGYYAQVFENPSKPYVLKIFVNDDFYLKYLRIIKANKNNPHVPRIFGNPVKITPTVSAVRLEKLIPLTGDTDPIFKKYVDPSLPPELDYAFDIEDENQKFAKKYHPELVKLMKVINRAAGMGGDNDLNYHNVMRRGDTLVITDPI
jgi:hypothetical protein